MSAGLLVEDRGEIRVLTLDRPHKRNALDGPTLEALAAALEPAATPHIRALLIQGRGTAFCSGYDLDALAALPPADGSLPDERLGEVLDLLERHPAPSVAWVQGAAFGAGCELAAACDFRVADDTAVLCLPPARLGVVYAPAGLRRVMALVGPTKAKLLFLTGRRVAAEQALAWGLVDAVHPAAHAQQAAEALCSELAAGAPLAVQGMKRGFALLARHPLSDAERAELRMLRQRAFQSEDVKEGRAAFLEKRPPRFSGR